MPCYRGTQDTCWITYNSEKQLSNRASAADVSLADRTRELCTWRVRLETGGHRDSGAAAAARAWKRGTAEVKRKVAAVRRHRRRDARPTEDAPPCFTGQAVAAWTTTAVVQAGDVLAPGPGDEAA